MYYFYWILGMIGAGLSGYALKTYVDRKPELSESMVTRIGLMSGLGLLFLSISLSRL